MDVLGGCGLTLACATAPRSCKRWATNHDITSENPGFESADPLTQFSIPAHPTPTLQQAHSRLCHRRHAGSSTGGSMKASAPNDYGTIPKATSDRGNDDAPVRSSNSSSYQNSNPLEIQSHRQQEGGAVAGGDDRAFQLPSPPPRQSPNQPPPPQQQQQQRQGLGQGQAKPSSSSSSSSSRWWLLVMRPKASAAHAAIAFLDSCVAGAIFPELPALAGACVAMNHTFVGRGTVCSFGPGGGGGGGLDLNSRNLIRLYLFNLPFTFTHLYIK